jgi:serine/threonine protein phosphatase PrpC
MEDLLGIGDFSARCGLSARMLRSYAAVGLLVPAAVDRRSGYRFYSTSQLHPARVVALLRRAGIAVEEIAQFLADPDLAQLDRWDSEIVDTATARRQALAAARAALGMDHRKTPACAAGTATHPGSRDSNQDAALSTDALFAVADGIGGLNDGDVASRLALEALGDTFAADRRISGLLNAVRETNDTVWQHGNAVGSTMGTTLTGLAMTTDTHAVLVHVGDSRLYRLRHGRLAQLTQDHTVTAELLRNGELTADAATSHPYRHVLVKAIGVAPHVEADYAGVSCEPGDRFVLCTDGLFNAFSRHDLTSALTTESDPQASADSLVASAADRGADDNATVVVVDLR